MSFESLLIHTVGIRAYTPGASDRYGNAITTYAAAVETPARVEQTKAREVLLDRDTRLTWHRIFLPATVSISALDHVEWDGRTLEVDGSPITWYDDQRAHHITAVAREIDG